MKKSSIYMVAVLFSLMGTVAHAQQTPTSDSNFPSFSTAQAAQHHCPFDVVVWVNTTSDTYNRSGPQQGDNKNNGAFMCQRDADMSEYHPMTNAQ